MNHAETILELLANTKGPMSPSDIAEKTGVQYDVVRQVLLELLKTKELERPYRGLYQYPEMKRSSAVPVNENLQSETSTYSQKETSTIAYPISGGAVGASWEVGVSWNEGEFMSMPRALIVSMVGFFPDPTETRWVNVKGDSMEPFLSDGTPVLVQRVRRVSESGRYVLWYGEDVEMVKRIEVLALGHLRISCDNLAYPSREYFYLGESMWEEVLETDETGKPTKKRTVHFDITARVIYPKDTSPAIVRMQNKG